MKKKYNIMRIRKKKLPGGEPPSSTLDDEELWIEDSESRRRRWGRRALRNWTDTDDVDDNGTWDVVAVASMKGVGSPINGALTAGAVDGDNAGGALVTLLRRVINRDIYTFWTIKI